VPLGSTGKWTKCVLNLPLTPNTKRLNPEFKQTEIVYGAPNTVRRAPFLSFPVAAGAGNRTVTLTARLVLDTVRLAGAASRHPFDEGPQVTRTRWNIFVSPGPPRNLLQQVLTTHQPAVTQSNLITFIQFCLHNQWPQWHMYCSITG
jgi:hypothetical protein